MKRRTSAIAFALAVGTTPLAQYSMAAPRPVQPTDFESPDGAFVLHVDPTEHFGAGPARYRMQRAGATAWEGQRPITLLRAIVADDGRAFGHALAMGTQSEANEHVVGAFDAAGTWREIERIRNVRPPGFHGPRLDELDGFAWNPSCDTIVATFVHGSSGQPTRLWRASSGERVVLDGGWPTLPFTTYGSWTEDLRALPGTPLFFAQLRGCGSAGGVGYRWLLVNERLDIVWDLDRGRDLDAQGSESLASEFHATLAPERHFEALLVSDHAIASYEAVADASAKHGWKVVELGRRAWEPEATRREQRDEPKPLALELVASVALGGPNEAEATPIREVVAWQPLADGRVEFVRRERGDAFAFVRLGATGAVELERILPSIEVAPMQQLDWFPLTEGAWIASRSEIGGKSSPTLWRIDAVGGAKAEFAYDEGPPEAICVAPDGGLVVLAQRSLQYGFRYSLTRYDAAGRTLWTKSDHSYTLESDPTALDSPEDIACMPDGRVVVLQNVHDRLQVLDADGEFERAIELEKAWGREPNYVANIGSDGADGVIVYDFHGAPPVWRMALDGSVRASWQPVSSEGRQLQCRPARAPDGTLWGQEGGHFYRFDASGREDRRLGAPTDPDRLVQPGVPCIDGFGRVLVVDQQNGWLHAFGAEAERLFVGRPDPNDFEFVLGIDEIRASASGDVYVESFQKGVVHYRADGTRVAMEADDGSFAWSADGQRRWRMAGAALELVGADGAVVRRVERDGAGRFFRDLADAAVAPSGRMALFDSDGILGSLGRVVVVEPDGSAKATHEVPGGFSLGQIATSGRWITAFQFASRCALLDTANGEWRAFDVPSAQGDSWAFGFSKDGTELWAASGEARLLNRYRLPE